MSLTYAEVMVELESYGNEKTKKTLLNHGAREPLFGVYVKDLKLIQKKIKTNQALAEELYDSGNYDAIYLAGMICDPLLMTEDDFCRWMEKAYCYMITDYTVSIVLAQSPLAFTIAKKWVNRPEELYMSAGYSAYCWLLGVKMDSEIDENEIKLLLDTTRDKIHNSPNRAKAAMNSFVIAVGVSYAPLHDYALKIAKDIGEVEVFTGKTHCKTPVALEQIEKAIKQGRVGFKRKNVRC